MAALERRTSGLVRVAGQEGARHGRHRLAGCALALALAVSAPLSGAAAAGYGRCTITVVNAGTLTPNGALKTLSSGNPGGIPARARVETDSGGIIVPTLLCSLNLLINCFTVSVVPPSGFDTAPATVGADVGFAASFDSGTSLGISSRVLLYGVYNLAFNLTATKTSGVFASGSYTAKPTIRCE
ncbi:hypothetical protein ASG43_19110 [Aureimonas sp. Leaf454]|nr:hypothetical protein ASG43_19110 [Aureimonas sp. Leaf454]